GARTHPVHLATYTDWQAMTALKEFDFLQNVGGNTADEWSGRGDLNSRPPAPKPAGASLGSKGCPARARKGASGSTYVFSRGGLEVNLCSKLEDTRVEGRSNLSKVAGTQAVTDLIEFGVVPGVKGFEAELEATAASLVQHEALEEREVPVVATRA